MAMPEIDFDQRRELGWKIYNEKIKPLVEPQEKGKFLVIDVTTGQYAIDRDVIVARKKLKAGSPDAVCYLMRIGFPAPYHIHGPRIRSGKP
jgi:hypothetical protein